MRTKTVIATALGVAALVGGGALAAVASGDSSSAPSVTLTAKLSGGMPLDLGRKGVSPGDEFVEHGVLSDAQAHAAGPFQMTTQLVYGNARRGHEQTTIVLYLAGGQLVATGGHGTTARYELPIVGGTGTYSAARGILAITPGSGETEHLDIELAG